MQSEYDKTLNLLKTDFSMRAALPQREPEFLKDFYDRDLYKRSREKNAGRPAYVLHDGPPYANGDIHCGTALNKILKDFIVRYKSMTGFDASYIPGWDTHGLPIELKAIKAMGIDRAALSQVELRRKCREFALKHVDSMRTQFKRLGVLGEWDEPYLTLNKEFEARQIEIFGEMARKGYIYKGLKPVYWCANCETALAEAEIEYSEDPCDSIYVSFRVTDDKGKLFSAAGGRDVYFIIWTTTTWTLPGNVAICLGPDFEYVLVAAGDKAYVVAKDLCEATMAEGGITDYTVLATYTGRELESIVARHPFLDRDSLVIVGDHVTLESGTGCVHTAPGHGLEDYVICLNYKQLPIIVPVDDHGKLTELAGPFAGLTTQDANKAIAAHLIEIGAMFAHKKIIHQYPHCWRCKDPIIYRATEQWFCSVDGFKDDAVKAIHDVRWLPEWGEERMVSMVRERADWCISRQRTWGVPIPIFYCTKCGKAHITPETIARVAALFRSEGSDGWYTRSAAEILDGVLTCECGCTEFKKETDIMDVWFDSGTSYSTVLGRDEGQVDLYIEGNDQYRGWFQSSLLTRVATVGTAPYRMVLTHGFVVDGEGKKMSKSIGNGVDPMEIVKQYGADILRLWVASADYKVDIRISPDILKQLCEVYRKIRNTARFILGNLYDFDPAKDSVPYESMPEFDHFALSRLNDLVAVVREAYDSFEYHRIFHALHNFCVVDMSNFYLDIIKDRLYIERPESQSRRSAQTVIFTVLDKLVRLIAPILVYTAQDIWQFMPGEHIDSVALTDMPQVVPEYSDPALEDKWEKLLAVREDVKKELEKCRAEKVIGSSLDAAVTLYAEGDALKTLRSADSGLKDILIVSQAQIVEGMLDKGTAYDCPGLSVSVSPAQGKKCARCWVYSDTVGENEKHPTLCSRCAAIIG